MNSPERRQDIRIGRRMIRSGMAAGALMLSGGIATVAIHDADSESAVITIPIGEGAEGIPIDGPEALGWTLTVMGTGLAGAGAMYELDTRRISRQEQTNGEPE